MSASGHVQCTSQCLLWAKSGHFSADFAEWMSSWRIRDEQVVSPDGSNRGEEQRHCVTIDSDSERPGDGAHHLAVQGKEKACGSWDHGQNAAPGTAAPSAVPASY